MQQCTGRRGIFGFGKKCGQVWSSDAWGTKCPICGGALIEIETTPASHKLTREWGDIADILAWAVDNKPGTVTYAAKNNDCFELRFGEFIFGVRGGFMSGVDVTIKTNEVFLYRNGWLKSGAWIDAIEDYFDSLAEEKRIKEAQEDQASLEAFRKLDEKYLGGSTI